MGKCSTVQKYSSTRPTTKTNHKREINKNPKIITLSHLDAVHDAVIDGKYEYAISKMSSISARDIPLELECYVQKLKYEIKRSVCDWDSKFEEETAEIMSRTMDEIDRKSGGWIAVDPFFALCLPFSHSQLHKLNEAHVHHQPEHGLIHRRIVRTDGILRIGYMSSDFHHHSLSHLVCSIPRYHNPDKVEVYVIHTRHRADFIPEDYFYRSKVNTGAKEVIDLSEIYDDDEAVKLLLSYDLDILVDYNATTSHYRHGILAKRPAKIQVMSLIGFCGSSGNAVMDYIVLDPTVASLTTVDKYFTEKGAFLPGSYMAADYPSLFPHLQFKHTLATKDGPIIINGFKQLPPWINGPRFLRRIEEMTSKGWNMLKYNGHLIYNSRLPEDWRSHPTHHVMVTTSRKEFRLPANAIVFSNFNHPWKLDPQTFKGWMQILRRVKDSVLWQLGENKTIEKNMKRFAQTHGVTPNRLIFSPIEEKELHLRRMQLSDITLDTTPFNGHTTSVDAMWVGLPLVTVTGVTAQGRVATSILKSMGIPQLIAETREEAIEIVVELGNNQNKLSDLKKVIQERRGHSSIFNVAEYVRNLEALYNEMMRRYREGKSPKHIILRDLDSEQVPIKRKPFVCYFCSKEFLNTPQLKGHLRRHTREKLID